VYLPRQQLLQVIPRNLQLPKGGFEKFIVRLVWVIRHLGSLCMEESDTKVVGMVGEGKALLAGFD
jgi:hypothetical protein